jgi:hypothetical protein
MAAGSRTTILSILDIDAKREKGTVFLTLKVSTKLVQAGMGRKDGQVALIFDSPLEL